jgi:hypothetical protein
MLSAAVSYGCLVVVQGVQLAEPMLGWQAVVAEFFVFHAGDFDVDIYAVQEGTRDPFLVAADHAVAAGPLA